MAGTTPNYGLPYPQSSDLVSAYPALGQDLATDLDGILAAKAPTASPTFTGTVDFTGATVTGLASAGLTLITAQTFSAASTVSVNNCFSATYDYYLMLIDGVASSDNAIGFRMRVSGSDATGANYNEQRVNVNNTTFFGNQTTGATFAHIGAFGTGNPNTIRADIYNPYLTKPTSIFGAGVYGNALEMRAAHHTLSTSYTGITLSAGFGAPTITGTLRIYGYKNS